MQQMPGNGNGLRSPAGLDSGCSDQLNRVPHLMLTITFGDYDNLII